MSEIDLTTSLSTSVSLSAQLYKNIESYPGQLLLTPPRLSARQEGKLVRADAVRAARHVERTSAHIRGGLDRSADMVIGARLIVHPTPDWDSLGITDRDQRKEFTKSCQRVFDHWAYGDRNLCDAEGHYDFSGLMWISFRNLEGPDGESAGVIHFDKSRRRKYATPWATFVTVLDPDRIETPPEKTGDPNVFQGRQLDEYGRCVGIYVRKGHPGEGWDAKSIEYEYVPRETYWGRAMSWHWFWKTRGQQQRGITPLITILRQSTMLSQFDDAQLGAAVISAVLATYIKSKSSPEVVAEGLAPAKGENPKTTFFQQKADYYDQAKMRVGGQRIPLMAPDDEIEMASVARAISDPTAFRTGFMREFGMALGLGQGQVANSFADFNYSSARAELLEVFRGVIRKRRQHNAHVASPIYGAVIEEAISIGALVLPDGWPPFQENRSAYTASEWTGPGMGNLDPLKEANAMLVRLQSKTSSRKREAASNGDDYLDIFDEIEDEDDEAEARGFDLEVKPSAAGLPSDGGPQEGGSPKRKKPGTVQGDGDGDGVPNENEQ